MSLATNKSADEEAPRRSAKQCCVYTTEGRMHWER